MNVKTERSAKNQQIQREQLQLVKMQKQLESVLGKVNETINALKVEQLQLKANAVTLMQVDKPAADERRIRPDQQESSRECAGESLLEIIGLAESANSPPADEQVNQQRIDLDMSLHTIKGGQEEEEDD